jgi:hypothetical protein
LGAELPRGFEVLSVIRAADQVRIRCRRPPIGAILAARATARILAYRSADPEPAQR